MNKYLIGAAMGVLVLIGIGTCKASADPLVDQVRDPAVRLTMIDGGSCSGTIINSKRDEKTGKVATYVLTAKHCVLDETSGTPVTVTEDKHDETLTKTGEMRYEGKLLGKAYKSDLALIQLVDENTLFEHTAKVAPKDIKVAFGQEVVIAGYPVGQSLTQTEGRLGYKERQEGFKDISESQQFYRATPDIVGGSSGSALFTLNGGEYQIIGVTTGGYRMGTFLNYFTPVDEINDYLETALSDLYKTKDDSKTDTKVEIKKSETVKVYQ